MYKLYSPLGTDVCKNRISEVILQSWKDRLFGIGYVGNINIYNGDFWIYNRISMYSVSPGAYKFFSARKFEGTISKNKDETIITGDFKVLTIYKIWWGIWFLILSLILFFCLYSFMLSSISFTSILPALIAIFVMYMFGFGIVKYNIFKGKKAEEETLEFIKSLLEVYSIEKS